MGSGKVKICCLDFFPELVAEGDTPKKNAAKKGGVNLKELIGSTTKVLALVGAHDRFLSTGAGYNKLSVKTWSSHFLEVQEQRKRSVTMLGNAITASKKAKTDQ
eukprot:2585-Amphidinium_carterae.1